MVWYKGFLYQTASWKTARGFFVRPGPARMVAKGGAVSLLGKRARLRGWDPRSSPIRLPRGIAGVSGEWAMGPASGR